MTKILVKQVNNLPVLIDARDHSEYAVSGYDIVCSAISTSFLLAVNILEKINFKGFSYSVNEKKAQFHLEVKVDKLSEEEKKYFKATLDGLVDVLKQIAEEYSKYLQITLN